MIALDTCAIIDLFKGDEKIKEKILELNEPFVTTMVNYLEIDFGIDLELKKHRIEALKYERFFDDIPIYNLSRKASRQASTLKWAHQKKGITIGNFDCIIAGILLTNGITSILTRNVKHFKNIKGIKVISY